MYLIIGRGHLARHLQHYFTLENIAFDSWNRDQSDLQLKLNRSQTVLLAISDDSLENFSRPFVGLESKKIIHFSGALDIPGTYCAHPLMTFSKQLYDQQFYRTIPFITLKGQPTFLELFPDLENPSFQIDPKDQELYHAICVASGNFTNILWKQCLSQFQKLGLSREAVAPYAKKCFENILENPFDSLTGPIARGDQITILKNKIALKNTPLAKLYSEFEKTHQLNGEI